MCTLIKAQKIIKTQFLVIGTNVAGIGAGIQAAKAGIKTIIIDSTTVLGFLFFFPSAILNYSTT